MRLSDGQLSSDCSSALFAGLIDSMVGGGGLVQIPALFTVLPGEAPATLFGTNKIASVFGTANVDIADQRLAPANNVFFQV